MTTVATGIALVVGSAAWLYALGWRMTLTIEDDGEDTWIVLRGGWKR